MPRGIAEGGEVVPPVDADGRRLPGHLVEVTQFLDGDDDHVEQGKFAACRSGESSVHRG